LKILDYCNNLLTNNIPKRLEETIGKPLGLGALDPPISKISPQTSSSKIFATNPSLILSSKILGIF